MEPQRTAAEPSGIAAGIAVASSVMQCNKRYVKVKGHHYPKLISND